MPKRHSFFIGKCVALFGRNQSYLLGDRKIVPPHARHERGESDADLSEHFTKDRKIKGGFEMKVKKMLAGVLAIVSLFCMSATAMAAAPTQELDSVEIPNEARIEAAKEVAYMDVNSASAEMQERILEAREVIIESKSWVANGWNATITHADGTVEEIPTFAELFPGWDMPVCESENVTRSSNVIAFDSPVSQVVSVTLPKASSATNTRAAFAINGIENELEVYVRELTTSTSCNLGFTNTDLGISVAHLVNMVVGDHLGVEAVPGETANIEVRASTYVTPGSAKLFCSAW